MSPDTYKALRRCVPTAFRNSLVRSLATRTLAALASHYQGKTGRVLAECLGIKEDILTRWQGDGELSFPMLAQILLVTERDWTQLAFRDGKLVLGEGEPRRMNLAAMMCALEAARAEVGGGPPPVALNDYVLASLVQLWRWGPADDRLNTRWVWDPAGPFAAPKGDGPRPEGIDDDEEAKSVRQGRREAAAGIDKYLAAAAAGTSRKPGRPRGDPPVQRLLDDWVAAWGEIAMPVFDIIREFCADPEPH
jgi:hypothetical protein